MTIQIKLALAQELANKGHIPEQLEEIRADAAAAVEELRVLAHGIYPTMLVERGLPDALRSVALTAQIPIDVVDEGIGRCTPTVEAAAYFCADPDQTYESLKELGSRLKPAPSWTFRTVVLEQDLVLTSNNGAVFVLPLAFFIVSGLGLLASALGIEPHLISNSVGLAGVVTNQVASTSKSASSWWVALSSLFVLLYATRVLLRAVAITHSLAWERSAASVKVGSRSFGVFGAVLVGQLLLVAGVGAVKHQTLVGGIATLTAFVLAVAGLWLIVSLEVSHANARWTDLIPGSLFYAVGLTGVLVFNVLILGHLIQSKTSTYGALGTAATLLLAFFFVGRVIVGAAVLNATLYERHSRSREKQSSRSHEPQT